MKKPKLDRNMKRHLKRIEWAAGIAAKMHKPFPSGKERVEEGQRLMNMSFREMSEEAGRRG